MFNTNQFNMEPLTSFAIIASLSIALFIVLIFYWLNKSDTRGLRKELDLADRNKKNLESSIKRVKANHERTLIDFAFTKKRLSNTEGEMQEERRAAEKNQMYIREKLIKKDAEIEKSTSKIEVLEKRLEKCASFSKQLQEDLHKSITHVKSLEEEFHKVLENKISATNKMSTAWRQVQEWKIDENGNQRTLTGAIDAGLDAKDKEIIALRQEVKELKHQLHLIQK